MVSNQNEFNNEYSKEVKEIRIKNKDFQGQLIIEDYLNLEKLYLRDIENIDTIILKNLPQLKWCTIRDCETKDLTIENCPQINSLNIENNLLISLEFIKDLENLEELETDGNDELSEILEPYEDDWKTYRENFQKLTSSDKGLTKENVQKLLRLQGENKKLNKELEISQQKYNELKKFLRGVLVSLSKDNQEELVNELNNEIETREKKIPSVYSAEIAVIKTAELTSGLRSYIIEELKESREWLKNGLTNSEKKIQELNKKLDEIKAKVDERQKKIDLTFYKVWFVYNQHNNNF